MQFSHDERFGNHIPDKLANATITVSNPPGTQNVNGYLKTSYEGTVKMISGNLIPIDGKLSNLTPDQEWVTTNKIVKGVTYPNETETSLGAEDTDETEDEHYIIPSVPIAFQPQCTSTILSIDRSFKLSCENGFNNLEIVGVFTGIPGIYTNGNRHYGFRYATGQIKLTGEFYNLTYSVLNGEIVDYDPNM